ncbi:hypothetical protein EBP22_17370 [Salmonella enterica subsp. enterica serovar Typhimurium]|nr:hypothetical protein [Salmonella enterica subsp. enterica serovar Typhimurium]
MVADVVVSSIKSFPDATSLALVSDLQFNEPYSSAALNRKFRGIVNPGFYGGFLPSPAGGLNLKITSGEEGGTASINIDKYYQMTVRQQADVTMPVTAGKKVIVVLEATYALGQETYQVNCKSAVQAAEIKFLEEGTALRQNQLELCTVTVPAGAPELTEEMIDISRRLNKTVGITLSGAIDSDADHIGASSHAVKKAVKAARDETEKQIEELVDNAPASLDTLKKIADAINNDPDFFNTLNAVLALKAPLHDPALTGIATVPTPPLSVSNKQIANTEFVQAAVAALVGSSPEALDTLAELADALGNDPNFATTMLNKLAGKQPLHEVLTSLSGLNSAANKLAFFNGPNSMALANLTAVGRVLIGQESVAKVLEYLGLVETINRAAQSVQRSEVQVSLDDVAAGKLLVNGSAIAVRSSYAGNGGPIDDANNLPGNAVSFVYGGAKNSPAGNSGTILDVSGFGGGYNIQFFANYTTGEILGFRTRNGDNKTWHKWNFVYHTGNKPTPTDVGALPITGGTLRGTLHLLFLDARPNANCMIANDDASGILSCAYGYYQDRFDIHFYDEKGAWASNPFTVGRNGNVTVTGNLGGGAVFDGGQRVYSPRNPQPVSFEGYATQSWVLQNFVQNIRVSAAVAREFRDGWGYSANDAAFATAISMVGGSSNVGSLLVRYVQKQINNNWYNITE